MELGSGPKQTDTTAHTLSDYAIPLLSLSQMPGQEARAELESLFCP